MSVSRRGFVRSLTGYPRTPSAMALMIGSRGHEDWSAELTAFDAQQSGATQAGRRGRGNRPEAPPNSIRLSSNENPLGPSQAALAAAEKAFQFAGRYPMNAQPAINDFRALVAKQNGLKNEQVALGSGSGEILDGAVRAFTSAERALVTGLPSYEDPAGKARQLKSGLKQVPVDAAGKLDIEKMIAESPGAGLVFICNPNNPTATAHGSQVISDAVARITKASPDTVILIDEAYHDYVTDPAYATSVPLIAQYKNVLVARTMSKAHGMAGLRIGYVMGQAEVVARLDNWLMPYNVSAMAVGAATVSLADDAQLAREKARNTEAKKFTVDYFKSAGFEATDSQTNFIFVKLGKPAKDFRDACTTKGILVGRDFPPMEKTHCRISIGTMEEMQKAVDVFKSVLGAKA